MSKQAVLIFRLLAGALLVLVVSAFAAGTGRSRWLAENAAHGKSPEMISSGTSWLARRS